MRRRVEWSNSGSRARVVVTKGSECTPTPTTRSNSYPLPRSRTNRRYVYTSNTGLKSATVVEIKGLACTPTPAFRHPLNLCCLPWRDFIQGSSGLRLFKIVVGLQTHPKLSAVAKVGAQSQRGIRRDGSFAKNNFIDPAGWHMNGSSQRILADRERKHELL